MSTVSDDHVDAVNVDGVSIGRGQIAHGPSSVRQENHMLSFMSSRKAAGRSVAGALLLRMASAATCAPTDLPAGGCEPVLRPEVTP